MCRSMKCLSLFFLTLVLFPGPGALFAESRNQGKPETGMHEAARHSSMKEDMDGRLEPGEYTVISPNGSITRSFCPYTCEMRGLPKEHCKAWKSVMNPELCYLQDTRITSAAVKFSGAGRK